MEDRRNPYYPHLPTDQELAQIREERYLGSTKESCDYDARVEIQDKIPPIVKESAPVYDPAPWEIALDSLEECGGPLPSRKKMRDQDFGE